MTAMTEDIAQAVADIRDLLSISGLIEAAFAVNCLVLLRHDDPR
jgi:hypothetical protein